MSFRLIQNIQDKTVLHVGGSPTSDFYHDLSLVYLRDVYEIVGFKAYFAIALPDGSWRIGASLSDLSEPVGLARLVSFIDELNADLVVPHMFCHKGMTEMREFLSLKLDLSMVGSSAKVCDRAQNKFLSKQDFKKAGVKVANGELASRPNFVSNISAQKLIVKPNSVDNSRGLSLIPGDDQDALTSALEFAFQYDTEVLVEEYIPGREIRTAVVEIGDKLHFLPPIEYLVSAEAPIRGVAEKLKLDGNGKPASQAIVSKVASVCPARISGKLFTKLEEQTVAAHRALSCSHYSLFDFRVDQSGHPYLLEAGLFWSFSRASMISRMIAADDKDPRELISALWQSVSSVGKTAKFYRDDSNLRELKKVNQVF